MKRKEADLLQGDRKIKRKLYCNRKQFSLWEEHFKRSHFTALNDFRSSDPTRGNRNSIFMQLYTFKNAAPNCKAVLTGVKCV